MKRMSRLTVLAVTLGMMLASAAQAQVLQQVPGDAMVVIRFANLQDTSKKIATWAQKMGFNDAPWNDPLGFAVQQSNLKGLKADGDAAMVIFAPTGRGEPPVMVLLPTTDYNAMVGSFGPPQKEGELDVVKMPGGPPRPGYAAKWGNYAAVGSTKDVLGKKPGGLALGKQSEKFLGDKKIDAVVYVNMKVAAEQVLPQMQQHREEMLNEVERAFKEGNGAPGFAPVIRALVTQAMGLVQDTFTDASGAMLGLAINDEGLNITTMADFKPDSKMGTTLSQMKNTDASLTAGLPEQDYVLYGGATVKPEVVGKVFDDFANPIIAKLKDAGDPAKPWSSLIDLYRSFIKSTTGGTMGLSLDPAANNGMLKAVANYKGDTKKIAELQGQMMDLMPQIQGMLPGPKQKITRTHAAKNVDDVKLDRITVTINANPQDPAEQMAAQVMTMIYGPNGPTTYSGVVADKSYLMVMGEDDAALKKAVDAAKSDADPLGKAANVKAVSAQLPQSRFAVGYVAIDKIMSAVVTVMNAQMGSNLKLDVPKDLPPVGMSMATEGSAIRMDVHISGQLVQSITAAILQMRMQMEGGGGRPDNL